MAAQPPFISRPGSSSAATFSSAFKPSSTFRPSSTFGSPSTFRPFTTFAPSSTFRSSSAFQGFSTFGPSSTFRPSSIQSLTPTFSSSSHSSSSAASISSSRSLLTSSTTSSILPTQSVVLSTDGLHVDSGLNGGEIAAVVVCSLVLLLGLLACLLFFLRRRQRRQHEYLGSPKSRNIGEIEKYREEDSKYTPYFDNRKFLSETGGTAPLLQHLPSLHWRPNSEADTQNCHDGHLSPYINEDDEMVNIPLRHDVSFGNSTPSAKSSEDSPDSVSLLPFSGQPQPQPRPTTLLPLTIPLPPSRRPSRGKKSIRDSGYDSDDTASIYSQASASTLHTSKPIPATKQSMNQRHSLPIPAVPLSPISQSPTTIVAPDFDQLTPIKQWAPIIPRREEPEEQVELHRENTVFVAKLLQSRQRNSRNLDTPTRSSSIVSHIERSDSIKAVIPLNDDEISRPRRVAPRNSRVRRKAAPPAPAS